MSNILQKIPLRIQNQDPAIAGYGRQMYSKSEGTPDTNRMISLQAKLQRKKFVLECKSLVRRMTIVVRTLPPTPSAKTKAYNAVNTPSRIPWYNGGPGIGKE